MYAEAERVFLTLNLYLVYRKCAISKRWEVENTTKFFFTSLVSMLGKKKNRLQKIKQQKYLNVNYFKSNTYC